MIGRHIPRIGSTLLLVASLLANPAGASEQIGEIDLSDTDREELSNLPGITEEEIDRLLDASGPGPEALGERLSTTAIPPERLCLWVPYLTLPRQGELGLHNRLRFRMTRSARKTVLLDSRLRVESRLLRLEFVSKHPLRQRGMDDPATAEFRASLRVTPAATLDLGGIRAGVVGSSPWENPLYRSGTGSATLPVFRRYTSRTAQGFVLGTGSFDLALWRWKKGGEGFLLWGETGSLAAWVGEREWNGRGIGLRVTRPAGIVIAKLHRSKGHLATQVEASSPSRSSRLSLAWGGGLSRLEMEIRKVLGGRRLRGAIAFLTGGPTDRRRRRYRFSLASGSFAGGLTGDERKCRCNLEGEGPLKRPWRARASVRLQCAPSASGRWRGELLLRRSGSRSLFEIGILARDDPEIGWPGIGARLPGGNFAASFRLTHTGGGIRFRGELFRSIGGPRTAEPERYGWRLTLGAVR